MKLQVQALGDHLCSVAEKLRRSSSTATRIKSEIERAHDVSKQVAEEFEFLVNNPPNATLRVPSAREKPEILRSLWSSHEESLRTCTIELGINLDTEEKVG